ncbi:hypothetical protein [Streptomyces sp. NPDC051561]|uniref:hypothetical protein n=1 Tax=Streptomyces sp. NPDC051561 TaxID=3365658 RepID=UPI0037B8EC17
MVTAGRSAWSGRLLLFAALLFGIVTMHTLGHPAEEHGGTGTTASGPAPAAHLALMTHESPGTSRETAGPLHGKAAPATMLLPARAATPLPAAAPLPAPGSTTPRATSSPHGSSHGMDPLSMCLAVLGAWGVALLGAWLVASRAAAIDLVRVVRGALLRALWPQPPPPRTVLARLSILRI